MDNNKKLQQVLEMHDDKVEDFGLPNINQPFQHSPEEDAALDAEWQRICAEHGVEVPEITEEEFEQQKKAA
jgi:hypothetical protein